MTTLSHTDGASRKNLPGTDGSVAHVRAWGMDKPEGTGWSPKISSLHIRFLDPFSGGELTGLGWGTRLFLKMKKRAMA